MASANAPDAFSDGEPFPEKEGRFFRDVATGYRTQFISYVRNNLAAVYKINNLGDKERENATRALLLNNTFIYEKRERESLELEHIVSSIRNLLIYGSILTEILAGSRDVLFGG